MSNKLANNVIRKKIIFTCSLIVLCISFISVWIDVYMSSSELKKKTDAMVLGVDYFYEEIEITNKRVESDNNGSISENYFFYYHNGSVQEYHKRMQVPATIYQEYNIGDKVKAYTTDHKHYSYEKYGSLLQNDFKNNELKKVIGVLLGIGIFSLLLLGILGKRALKNPI